MKAVLTILFLFASFLTGFAQSLKWANQMTNALASSHSYGSAIMSDTSGNVYTTGSFNGKVDFDPGAGAFYITSAGSFGDIFIQKLDPAGNFLWAKAFTGDAFYDVYAIAIDAAGAVYTTGWFQGAMDFDPSAAAYPLTATGQHNAFVTKLDASGNFVWAKHFDGNTFQDRCDGYTLTLGSKGQVYISGTFAGTLDFDPDAATQNLSSNNSSYDVFLVQLANNGDYLWARRIGGTGLDYGTDVCVDVAGDIVLTGTFDTVVDFDPGAGTVYLAAKDTGEATYMLKLDSAGSYKWAKIISGDVFPTSVATDKSAVIYVTGGYSGTVDFNPGSSIDNLSSSGGYDIFLLKLDNAGNYVWTRSFGGVQRDFGFTIAVDAADNICLAGDFETTVDFDPGGGTKNLGSNGNCYYVGNETEAVFIDAGLSCRETERRMRTLGLEMEKVKAIFISHEHADHISGLPSLSKKWRLPVYITNATHSRSRLPLLPELTLSFRPNEEVEVGGLRIMPFPKYHDGCDPHSFTVSGNGVQIGVFTDIGKPCKNLVQHFKDCDAAFLEANYDEVMLEQGRYPLHLKNRIRNGHGHLSNRQALDVFISHKPAHMSHLLLAHLSKENNHPALVESLFKQHAGNTEVIVASRYVASAVYTILPFAHIAERLPQRPPTPAVQEGQLALF